MLSLISVSCASSASLSLRSRLKLFRQSSILSLSNSQAQSRTELKEMVKLAHEAKNALAGEAFDEFGKLLYCGWELKKQLSSNVTNTEIDDIYQTARKAQAIGVKITGAGGGFLLLYRPPERRYDVRSNLPRCEVSG